ncbi:floricaula/leafy homolog 2 [Ananas comosus]|uniref:Floricaula/leafy-like transcription factor n=1 Tax=Ananas comosus TaxID=4615 RepID=A0A6P5GQV2_ANACO|nr:floricaula/leafy homolog 2 [Ananas comosus]
MTESRSSTTNDGALARPLYRATSSPRAKRYGLKAGPSAPAPAGIHSHLRQHRPHPPSPHHFNPTPPSLLFLSLLDCLLLLPPALLLCLLLLSLLTDFVHTTTHAPCATFLTLGCREERVQLQQHPAESAAAAEQSRERRERRRTTPPKPWSAGGKKRAAPAAPRRAPLPAFGSGANAQKAAARRQSAREVRKETTQNTAFVVTEPGEVARAKKNGLDYLFHLYEQCRLFLLQVQSLAKEHGHKCPTKVTNQVFRYAKKVGASYINKPKMRHYVHCYALHCLDEEASNALRRAFKERGENVGAWRQACYNPLVAISARHGWDIDAVFNAHPRLSIWYVPTKLRQLCHLARSNAAAAASGLPPPPALF